jgi:hypothetical protein
MLRVALLGEEQGAFTSGDLLVEALGAVTAIERVRPRVGGLGLPAALAGGARAISGGAELVHLLDPRLSLAARLLRRRYGVPVTATVAATRGRLAGAIHSLDAAFTGDAQTYGRLTDRFPGTPCTLVSAGVPELPEPHASTVHAVARALGGAAPQRFVVAMPWPDDGEHVRWVRDAVLPLLHGNPLCLVIGAPRSREARLIGRRLGANSMRVVPGRLTAGTVVAAARYADTFVVPGSPREGDDDAVLLAMAATGVPVVAGGGILTTALEHERSALLADPGDPMGLASTLNKLLALPALQRHELGAGFADWVRRERSWSRAAEVYGERFAVLVGRPRIPAELRAA